MADEVVRNKIPKSDKLGMNMEAEGHVRPGEEQPLLMYCILFFHFCSRVLMLSI